MKERVSLCLVVVGLWCVTASSAGEVALDEVPEAVKQAALAAMPGIELVEAEVEQERQGMVYELEGTLDGKRYEIEVTSDGTVLEVELEEDEEIPVTELPQLVRQAAEKALPGAELIEAEIVRPASGMAYEIEARQDGKEYEILVGADGRLLGIEEESEEGDDDTSDDDDKE